MALVRVKHASLWVGGKKQAECNKNDVDVNSGDEPQIGDDGFMGMSDGATTTTLEFDSIVPVSGMSSQVEQLLLTKADVDMNLGYVNGKLWQITMRCTRLKYSSDAKTGTLSGSFTFMGGVPSLT